MGEDRVGVGEGSGWMTTTRRTTILATSLISKTIFFLCNDNDRENREEQLRLNLMDLAGEQKKR